MRWKKKQKLKCVENRNKAIIIITIEWLFYCVSTFRWCRIRVTKNVHMRLVFEVVAGVSELCSVCAKLT